jgi:hypothetical protein
MTGACLRVGVGGFTGGANEPPDCPLWPLLDWPLLDWPPWPLSDWPPWPLLDWPPWPLLDGDSPG